MTDKSISEKKFSDFQNGDPEVFKEIFNLYVSRVNLFIHKIIKSEAEAEELTQDVFLVLWKNRETLHSKDKILPFLFRTAKFTTTNHISKKISERKYIQHQINEGELSYCPENEIHAQELDLLIKLIVSEMSEQRQKVFNMSRVEGMSNEEIAKKLKLSPKTVYNHIYSALILIKKIIR